MLGSGEGAGLPSVRSAGLWEEVAIKQEPKRSGRIRDAESGEGDAERIAYVNALRWKRTWPIGRKTILHGPCAENVVTSAEGEALDKRVVHIVGKFLVMPRSWSFSLGPWNKFKLGSNICISKILSLAVIVKIDLRLVRLDAGIPVRKLLSDSSNIVGLR